MTKEVTIFETSDLDLAAYLMLQDFKYIESRLDNSTPKPKVIMRFFDEKGTARDLERAFMGSEISKYRTFHKYLLKDIHRTMKGL